MDGTVGLGGHAVLMAEAVGGKGRVIGIDRDPSAVAAAQERLLGAAPTIHVIKARFWDMAHVLEGLKIDAVDGILLDLGISSMQLDRPERGFAFAHDGPLDMRMDPTEGQSAADLVGRMSESDLARIIWELGEERFAKRIARSIVHHRSKEKIERTSQLAQIVLKSLPVGYTRGRIHPATRTFQALRIAVNEELDHLSAALETCAHFLKPGGRLCVIAFHSLEDRIVKTTFRRWGQEGMVRILTKKPMKPTDAECASNPRSRSACLRAIEKNI